MKTESCNRKCLLIGLKLIVMLIVLTGGIATTYAKNSSANSDLVSASETDTEIAYLSDMKDEFSMTNNQLGLDENNSVDGSIMKQGKGSQTWLSEDDKNGYDAAYITY